MNSTFGACWLASSEVISQVLFTFKHRATCETLKIDHFTDNQVLSSCPVVFSAIYSTCVVYTKTIIIITHAPLCQWTVVDFYLAPSRLGKYPLLFTSTLVNNNYNLLISYLSSQSFYLIPCGEFGPIYEDHRFVLYACNGPNLINKQ